MIKKYIKEMGIDEERLRLEWISASEGKRFAEVADEMAEKVKELGHCKAKEVIDNLQR